MTKDEVIRGTLAFNGSDRKYTVTVEGNKIIIQSKFSANVNGKFIFTSNGAAGGVRLFKISGILLNSPQDVLTKSVTCAIIRSIGNILNNRLFSAVMKRVHANLYAGNLDGRKMNVDKKFLEDIEKAIAVSYQLEQERKEETEMVDRMTDAERLEYLRQIEERALAFWKSMGNDKIKYVVDDGSVIADKGEVKADEKSDEKVENNVVDDNNG